MLAIFDPEVQLLNIPDQPDQPQQQSTISVPAGTIPQDQGVTSQLLPTNDQQQAPRDMLNNLPDFPHQHQQQHQQQQQQQHQQQDLMQLINSQPLAAVLAEPHVVIVEQPASRSLRFRYKVESRGAGLLQGATSTDERKTFPKIQIRGYMGPWAVVVSCVTNDLDKPKAHPHMLVSPVSVSRKLVPS